MPASRRLIRFARQNRRDTGLAETLLWNELRGKQLGPRFRRQDPQGPYIADFTCRRHKLVIEVDDWSHTDPARDRDRDDWFLSRGWFMLRIDDTEILEALDETIDLIIQALEDPQSIVNPLNRPEDW
ncbi:MAG: DUF559 domain-containing protein [Acidimicrobiia bacterium]|nr:DUF559 domain-containing protein [Acidimicrobiia bacterium]